MKRVDLGRAVHLDCVGPLRTPLGVTLLVLAILVPGVVHAETVIARKRLGNNVEGLTYDPLRDRAVAIDGNDVIGIALNPIDAVVLATMRNDTGGISGIGYRKLFDVLALPVEARTPRGIAYLPMQHRYVFTTNHVGGTGALYTTDESGNALPPIALKGLSQPVDFWEGLTWIPPGAPAHPGTLAVLGARSAEGFISHLYYVRLDGTVEQEIVPTPGTPLENYLCGIAFWPADPSHLLVTDCGPSTGLYAMDAQTGALAPGNEPLFARPADAIDTEGVIVRRDGSFMVSGYAEGRLCSYDRSFHRKAGDDRLFIIGLGMSFAWLGWNPDSNEFLALSQTNSHVYALSSDLESSRIVFDVPVTNEVPLAGSIFYLGNNQVGLGNRGYPRGIDIAQLVSDRPEFPNGTSISRLLFPAPAFPAGQAFSPRGFSLLDPSTVLVRVTGDTSALKVVTLGGTPDSSIYRDGVIPTRLADIVLSSATQGFGAQVFDDGTGKHIFTGAEIYRIDGTLTHRIDWKALGLTLPANDGVWLGGSTFATTDFQTSSIVIYSVP